MIKLTLAAESHFAKLLKPNQKVVLGTKRSGCSGLSYCLDVKDQCDETQYQKLTTEQNIPFLVEKKSLPYLKGLVIDWVKEGLQSRIVYNNPNEVAKCGCGESFTVDEKA